MNFNPLKPVWITYEASKDALKITKRTITHDDKETLLFRTTFESQELAEANQTIENSLKEVEDLFVLSLWSTFERFIRRYLGATLQTTQPITLAHPIYEYFCDEVEFWKPNQILDLLKRSLFSTNPHIIGQAKQIIEYRDWVAHGKNPNKQPSSNITPHFAYKILNEIVEMLLLN